MGGRHCKEVHILDNTTWLRNVIEKNAKLKKNVQTFESFTIEPFICPTNRISQSHDESLFNSSPITDVNGNMSNVEKTSKEHSNVDTENNKNDTNILCKMNHMKGSKRNFGDTRTMEDDDKVEKYSPDNLLTVLEKEGIKHFKVTVCYKNRKDKRQKLHWIIKTASYSNKGNSSRQSLDACLDSLMHEINAYEVLIAEISKYLKQHSKRPQAKYLLNLPDFIHAEYKYQCQNIDGKPNNKCLKNCQQCCLVLEDISFTKNCYPVRNERIATGLTLSQFKVFLATLAQTHGVGISWRIKNPQNFLDIKEKYPYLDNNTNSGLTENLEEGASYLRMYEQLLRWYFGNDEDARQIRLFSELKNLYFADQTIKTGNENLNGLCLGKITSLELNYQYDLPKITKCEKDWDDIYEHEDETSQPVCAAVNDVHQFHFGNIFKELAYMFYSLPDPMCRSHYMVPLLELYSDVLRQTFDMLDLDWKNTFQDYSIVKVLQQFYCHIPGAIIDSIIVQMKYTNIKELNDICTSKTKPMKWNDTVRDDKSNEATTNPSKFIPLSIERIEYLISLLDSIYKSV